MGRELIFDSEIWTIWINTPVPVSLEDPLDIVNDEDVIAARHSARVLAAEIGFSSTEQTMVAAVITELARNILDYAGRGEVVFRAAEDSGRRGIVVIASDRGPGIPNIKLAMQASYRVAGGLGVGLRGVKGLMDSLDIISGPGSGTIVTARKWKS
jgi:serine/threonine-protein kinase RsbT